MPSHCASHKRYRLRRKLLVIKWNRDEGLSIMTLAGKKQRLKKKKWVEVHLVCLESIIYNHFYWEPIAQPLCNLATNEEMLPRMRGHSIEISRQWDATGWTSAVLPPYSPWQCACLITSSAFFLHDTNIYKMARHRYETTATSATKQRPYAEYDSSQCPAVPKYNLIVKCNEATLNRFFLFL